MTTRKGVYQPTSGPALAYTLHLPSSSSPTSYSKLALIAHPYGRLGGSQHDHLVVSLARTLTQEEGYAVLRYDARGSGKSEGSGSWSCLPEAGDYHSLLHSILLPLAPPSSSSSTELLLAGYSAGSLSASHCPTPSLPNLHTRRLLISYPLSVSWALTLLRSGTFSEALRKIAEEGEEEVLEIHGDGDQFTGVGRYRSWAGELGRVSSAQGLAAEGEEEGEGQGRSSRWKSVEVEGADHFWVKREAKKRLLSEVREWLRS